MTQRGDQGGRRRQTAQDAPSSAARTREAPTRRDVLRLAGSAMVVGGLGLFGVAGEDLRVESRRDDELHALVRPRLAPRPAVRRAAVVAASVATPAAPAAPIDPGDDTHALRAASEPPAVGERAPEALSPADRLPVRLIVPTIDLNAPVVEIGTRYKDGDLVWATAAFAVGHLAGTKSPGEPGNCVLSGHVSSIDQGDIFHRLPWIQQGDGVTAVSARNGAWVYQVASIDVVLPEEVHILDQSDYPQLILMTCVPDHIYTHRLVVYCDLVGSA